MAYWVYVNEPNDKALVHQGDCSHCNEGEGRRTHTAENGKWLGPFERSDALRAAKGAGKKNTRWCGHCAKRLNIAPEI